MLISRTVNNKQEPNIQIAIDKLNNIIKYICITIIMIIMHHLATASISIMKKAVERKGSHYILQCKEYTLLYSIVYTTLYTRLAHRFRTPFSKVLDYLGSTLETRDHRTRVDLEPVRHFSIFWKQYIVLFNS